MNSRPDRTSVLTGEQKDMLFFIYQVEKVARDVYMKLGQMYKNESIFGLMQMTEEKHLDCARRLCDIYGVDRSPVDESVIGAFDSPLLKMLYDAYIEKGRSSLRDALEIAEFIGASDLEMIEHASVGMPSDVVSVYEKLKKSSLSDSDTSEPVIYRAA